MSLTIHAIKCPKCEDIIFSRAGHDFHNCSCGTTAIDGGFDYQRIALEPPFNFSELEHIVLELDISKNVLYDDWNRRKNKYGIIKKGDPLWK